jgi:glycine cleavage system P protein (glycine dehydrogenase) subunit 2
MLSHDSTQLLFEMTKPGSRGARLPECDCPVGSIDSFLPERFLADSLPPLPELTEPDLTRHYTNLSTRNMSVDTHFYPLGSCTMKYNPKRNERIVAGDDWSGLHPYQPDETVQGVLEVLFHSQEMLAEIAGLPAVSLQPAAGAHGELTALLTAAAYLRDTAPKRINVLIPDQAHGTNPASAAVAGFKTVEVKSDEAGHVNLDDLAAKLDDQTAVFMITNPNTLGLFDQQIGQIAQMVHDSGGLVYLDGANMNAIMGVARPGDFGADMMHYNPHKTFSTPHGGGGPGAGPIAVCEALAPYLPSPIVVRDGDQYRLDYNRPKSIGRVRTFFGSVGVLLKMYCYILTHGPEGVRSAAENSVLNANYLLTLVRPFLDVPHGGRCMHEFVASAAKLKKERGISAMDIAKRLLDFGFHPPTVYFPLIVAEALMIEPTETESKETLERFADALSKIVDEPGEKLHDAPSSTEVCRPDEVAAARKPILRWTGD